MSFKDLEIKEEYRSDRTNIIQDFYLPCLSQTVVYSRAVGFFSSTSIVAVAGGLTGLIKAGGRMRLVASPSLSAEDVEAITTGLKQREEVVNHVILQVLATEFEAIAKDRLACLAWLLSQEILEIKLAIPRNLSKLGIYHEKLGIFEDREENKIAFTGSANETYLALNNNFECIDVFCSWKEEEKKRTERKVEHFKKLWNNRTSKVEIIDFPEAATRKLLKYRPNQPPSQKTEIKQNKKSLAVAEESSSYQTEPDKQIETSKSLHGIEIELRPYQNEALKKFIAVKHRGILAMATGAGKTITALACATNLEDLNLIFIVVPTKELVQQWIEELEKFTNFYSPVKAIGKSNIWKEQLFRKLRLINLENQASKRLPTVLVGIYSELSKLQVLELIEDAGGLPHKSLIIADEVHTAGAEQYRRILRDDFTYRLGLSATPIRPHDEGGTKFVLDYFGDIIYEFSLEAAIELGILCQYQYFVYPVSLSEEEHEKFQLLTSKIGNLLHSEEEKFNNKIKSLTIQRAKIIKSASNKINILDQIIQEHSLNKGMIYCADINQTNQVCQRLAQKGLSVARYSSKDQERSKILAQFERGYLDALVAVKCLDEGVNIPAASEAIILASDTSERQFIQRRGRILRAAKGKAIATLIDILVVPPIENGQVSLIASEIRRIKHFAKTATNRASVVTRLVEQISHYGITYSDLI